MLCCIMLDRSLATSSPHTALWMHSKPCATAMLGCAWRSLLLTHGLCQRVRASDFHIPCCAGHVGSMARMPLKHAPLQVCQGLYQQASVRLQQRRPPRSSSNLVGMVRLVLRSISLPQPENVFVVLKCGPHWGKTVTRHAAQAGSKPVWNWQVRLSVPPSQHLPAGSPLPAGARAECRACCGRMGGCTAISVAWQGAAGACKRRLAFAAGTWNLAEQHLCAPPCPRQLSQCQGQTKLA